MRPGSLQFRVPLTLLLSAFTTTIIVVIVLAVETWFNLQQDQLNQARNQAYILQPVLKQSLKHDDPWQAYTVLHGPDQYVRQDVSAEYKILLDTSGNIFSSGNPKRYPIGQSLITLAPFLEESLARLKFSHQPINLKYGERIVLLVPILEQGISIGTLVYFTRSDIFWNRFAEIMQSASIAILLTLSILAPVGWYLGKRLVTPLIRLVDCMQQVGARPIENIKCIAFPHQDEISRLGQQFSRMLEDLKSKRELENRLVTQDRLAAVGRLAGGVAHEINNPLAGMLVAIDTWKQTPSAQRNSDKTMAFMERGLQHIQETVSALLVECRFEKRKLQSVDIDDLVTLVKSESQSRNVTIKFENRITSDVDIPATLIRQILLNLSLNALQALSDDGTIEIKVWREQPYLMLEVGDDGHMIEENHIKHIFEPFHTDRPGGTGLGLWVTYETIRQLNGEITVESTSEWTRFNVRLPETSMQT